MKRLNGLRRVWMTMLMGWFLIPAVVVYAQDIEEIEEIENIATDSLIAEIADPDPEWYVAPISYDSLMARHNTRRAAADCPIDSVLTFDEDSVLTYVSIYEHGDTTRTITWLVNPDGSRVGNAKTESGTNGNITFSATYAWDNTTNDWKGTSKEEHIYENNKETVRILYNTWLNNAWVADTKYTWVYDASGREAQYTTYIRNTSTNDLILSKRRIREYNASGKTTLDIQYTAHNGTDWSAGTKRIYDYDGSNTILNEYYSAYNNGTWVGSSKEIWTYTSGKKTYYEKQTWSNGGWVNSSKEIWEFNGPSGKQTLHENYSWVSDEWAITVHDTVGYDALGNKVLDAKYTITNGIWKGKSKTEFIFSGKTSIGNITYKWVASKGDFDPNVWTVQNNHLGDTIENCKYTWNNGWVGNGYRTLSITTGTQTDLISQIWSTDKWANYTLNTTFKSGGKQIQEATYLWSGEINDWVGTSRSDWHYNAAGLPDTIKTYTVDGSGWLYSKRTINSYNAAGTNIMTHKSNWNGTAWVLESMTRKDILDQTIDGVRQTLNASWRCSSDSVWIGVSKDTIAYSAVGKTAGKKLFEAHFTSWANNDWVPSTQFEYEYNANGDILLQQRKDWVSNAWKGIYRYETGYDEEGRTIMYATYNNWSTTYNNWVGTTKTESVLNDKGSADFSYGYIWKNNDWYPSYKNIFTRDEQDRTTELLIQAYSDGIWVNSSKKETAFSGDVKTKENNYVYLNNQWVFSSRSEQYYDDDAQAKLRREILGSWDEGVLQFFSDDHYFYDCDHPYFTIRFEDYDGTLLQSSQVKETKMPVYKGATPSRPATSQYTYTFKGWKPAIVAAMADATYVADYDSVGNAYTITWLNEDGSQLDLTYVSDGVVPTHDAPTKQSTAEYTYTFAGWTPQPVAATANATYQATFNATKNSYTITWLNWDNSQIDQTSVEYGVTPTHADPMKAATAQYTYTFKGWTPAIVPVTGNATYKADYDSTLNSYLIIFKNYNGEELQSGQVAYGVMPAYTGTTPTKPATEQCTYTFKGWKPVLQTVTGEATYVADFDSIGQAYTIAFVNYDGTELQSTQVEYGVTPVFTGENPTKPANTQYTYTFKGWTPAIVAVIGNATYKADFDSTLNSYLITFKNYDGTVLQSGNVTYGQVPAYAQTPEKPATAQYTYTFKGWTPALVAVSGESTYVADYDSTLNSYLITWLNEDGSEIDSETLAYGATLSHADAVKQNTAEYTYTFTGWTPEVTTVTGNATYQATFSATKNSYLITWQNEDGSEIDSETLEYGVMPTHDDPVKQNTAEYTYTFTGWTPEIAMVTGNATYQATFSATKNSYLITWQNEDGTEMDSETLEYGVMPTHDDPTKAATTEYTYTFAGWTPEVETVSGVATYRATFSATKNSYLITFKNYDGTVLQSTEKEYGQMPTIDVSPTKPGNAQYSYSFQAWSPEIVPVTGDATYTALYDSVVNTYTVIFYYEDGVTELERQTVAYGEMPNTELVPSIPGDAQYTYIFAGWSPEIVPVTGDASYTATYERIVNQYTITFKNYNGQVLQSMLTDYGTMPEYTGETPARQGNVQYSYIFTGWTPEVTTVTGEATYTAVFESEVNTYTVTFYDEDGVTVLDEVEVAYGQMPSTDVVPTKEDDEQYRYTFAGWTPALAAVTGDTSYRATYTATDKHESLSGINADVPATKIMINGIFYIKRGDKLFTLDGVVVE